MVDTEPEASLSNTILCGQDLTDEINAQYSSYLSPVVNNGTVSSTTWPKIRVSGADVKVKEIILVSLALFLLVTSLCLFYKNWKKNYRDINQLPYYSYMYKMESPPPTLEIKHRAPTIELNHRAPTKAPVMHWAKAAAVIGTGLAFSNTATNQSNNSGMHFSVISLNHFNIRILEH